MQNWPEQLRSKVKLTLFDPKIHILASCIQSYDSDVDQECLKFASWHLLKVKNMIFLKIHKNDPYSWGQMSNFDLIWPKNSHFGSIDAVRIYQFEPKFPKSCFLVLIISRRKHFLKIRKVDLYGWSQKSIFVLIWPRNSHFGFIFTAI